MLPEEDFNEAKKRILFGSPKRRPVTDIAVPRSNWSYPDDSDLIGWALLPLRRYAEFDGRSTRKEFWLFQLVPFAIVFGMVITLIAASDYSGPGAVATLVMILGAIGLIGLIVPQIAVQVRRFHDQNLSGLLALLNLVPYMGGLVVFVFMFIEGTRGENKFGPDPRDQIGH